MAEQTHNRDMSDEPDRQDLEDRVEQLESTISKMLPGRRDALKLGGAALLGGAAMSGAASAQPGDQDGEAGVIGTDNSPVDIEASDIEVDDLVVNNTATSSTIDVDQLNPQVIGKQGARILVMSTFPGSNPNIRFDNCLAAAQDGDTVILEDGVTQDKTITKRIHLTGTGATSFNANLTVAGSNVSLSQFAISRFQGHQLILDTVISNCTVTNLRFVELIINGNNTTVIGCIRISITDNGTNNVFAGNN